MWIKIVESEMNVWMDGWIYQHKQKMLSEDSLLVQWLYKKKKGKKERSLRRFLILTDKRKPEKKIANDTGECTEFIRVIGIVVFCLVAVYFLVQLIKKSNIERK